MPLAKRPKLSLDQEIANGGDGENGSSVPALIKLEPVEDSTKADNENYVISVSSASQVLVKPENETASASLADDGSSISVSTSSQVLIKSDNDIEPTSASLADDGSSISAGTASQELVKSDDEPTSASLGNDGSSLFELEKESCRRARSKSVGEVVVEFKPVRISERLSIKRNRLGDIEECDVQPLLPPPAVSKKQKNTSSSNVSKPQKKATPSVAATARKKFPKGGKERKPWISWSVREQNLFYMYLGMFGKNFEAISKKIEGKDKKQVRYFYYRCWAKVCKVIRMHQVDVGVKTVNQELYCLINYGALRKEVKESDPQFSDCLYELIGQGETTYVLSKGGKKMKNVKVKTPMCTYLRNLLKIEELKRMPDSIPAHKLPSHVTLELTPKTSTAWAKVQELSQNPRVRFKLSTNRTLESVFKYLSGKWKSSGTRIRETLGDDIKEDRGEDLVFHLHPSSTVKPFTMRPAESKRMNAAFKNYMGKILPNFMKSFKNGQNTENENDQTDVSPPIEDCGEDKKLTITDSNEEGSLLAKTEAASQSNGEGLNDLDNTSQNESVSIKNSSDDAAKIIETASMCKPESTDKEKNVGLNHTEPCSVLGTEVMDNDSVSSSSWSCSSLSSATASSFPSSTTSSSADLHSTQTTLNECISLSPNPKTPPPPLSPPVPSSSNVISSPLRSLTAALKLKPVSSFPVISSSSSVSSSLSPSTSTCQVSTNPVQSFLPPLLSPSSNKKKVSKTCIKKTTTPSICDNYLTNSLLSLKEDSNSIPPNATNKLEADSQFTEDVKKEIDRLQTLTESGFSMTNSNTVTLLHLSLLLGCASVIRLEYEWVEKLNANSQQPPAFCAISNQVTNVLRRLCHIAALELAGFQINNKQSSNSKGSNKSESVDGGNKKEEWSKTLFGRNKKSQAVRNVATMTDFRMTIPAKAIPFAPAKLIHHTAPEMGSTPTIQLNGTESVFRVPLVPTFRPMLSKEQEQKLKMQHEQANAIMHGQHVRSRLLKRRNIPSRKGKQPAIIVQRTLLPKPGGTPVVVSMSPQVPTLPPLIQAPNTSALEMAMNNCSTSTTWAGGSQPSGLTVLPAGTNILELAVKSAQIGSSPTKDDSMSSVTDLFGGESGLSLSHIMTSPSSSSPTVSKEPHQSSIPDHADISISDFDLSLASSSVSNVGPDAGDKFLDSVLERSQGFSGLITPVSKDNSNQSHLHVQTSSISVFNISGMKTPPHTSTHSSSTSPDKLTLSDQSWMAGESADVSLSSILGEFSSFQGGQQLSPQLKTPSKTTMSHAVLFDQSSSDAVDHLVTVSIAKPSFVNDVSLNCLLGDPSMSSPLPHVKEEDDGQHPPDPSMTPLLAPPTALFSEASQDSLAKLDVDVTLQGMVNESSVDLVSKFEKLAAQMAENRQDLESSRLNTPVKQEPGTDIVKDHTAV